MKASRLTAAVGALVVGSMVDLTVAAQQRSDGSRPNLQGVWRVVERTSTAAGPSRAAGTQRDPQPGLFFLSGKH